MWLSSLLLCALIRSSCWGRGLPPANLNSFAAAAAGPVRELAKMPGASAHLTYSGPRDWTACTVTQLETTHTCRIVRSSTPTNHTCEDGISISQHLSLCSLTIYSVQQGHNGTWVAEFERSGDNAAEMNFFSRQIVALTVIAEPTAIEWRPQPISGQFNYIAGEPWSVAVVVHNVRPRPRIYWTMNNETIEGLIVTTSEVDKAGVLLTVTETISLTGKEAYNGDRLEYRIELEAVDEEGGVEVVYSRESREQSAQLRCQGCHKTSTATTTEVTTAPEATTTTETMMPPVVPCSFNMTGGAGEIDFPLAEKVCSMEPAPTWTIRKNFS
jgi:hypothetical protein